MARMFHIILVEPQIPPNTGNVIRLAANTGCTLHLIEPLGFDMQDKLLQRAGLDYHEYAAVFRHASWDDFLASDSAPPSDRLMAFTTKGTKPLSSVIWQAGDGLVFGNETAGLSPAMLARFEPTHRVRLPMMAGQRSLNLSNAAAVAVFDAWRQLDYRGAT
jgi:tRNA (cytidine/uridine-2'-O-)-methyltransferase